MKWCVAAVSAAIFFASGTLSAADDSKQAPHAQGNAQSAPAGDGGADLAAAHALLDSWKGEIEIIEQARHKLNAAWQADPKNPAVLKELERYQVLRKQMLAIQRKTRGGSGIAEVRKILDTWSGQPEVLAQARQALDKVLAGDPFNAYAFIETARLEMMRGYMNNRYAKNGKFVYEVGNFAPSAYRRAIEAIGTARGYDPLAGDVYVMQSYIYFQQAQLDAAEQALKTAESMGATDPRLHLYWADVHFARGNYPAAVERVQRALQGPGDGTKTKVMANTRLASIYQQTGEAEKAIAAHKALIDLEPQNAWIHNNYSAYLCNSLGRNDEAIAEARSALRIMDFGAGHMVLASALYGKWADLVAEHKAGAEPYFDEARRLRPNLDEVMAYGAALPTGERLAKALISKRVSIDARAFDGSTALLIATNLSRNQTVKFLLGLKANPNVADANGWTPLLSAASEGNPEGVDLLLAKGADIRATLSGKDAATLAEQNGYPELAASLRKRMTGRK